mmetsp:Transcript_13627/g.19907  ORF Transcript_13627/g.19907 Transcript_13627/m.19907 type:complete len:173 (-) Transcript_13627:88-606(-)|eukprot:CAMPEP_0202436126 /NCGR_PEP_ID=MMETSP1345-20130828/23154_1 /ASSEMBLY_ACC=CAM_ASM_000843 /TAXON_ID=342563 /ORGANISM="Fabrea Fabrea salina" /LENGTH=172 /DNA_ID=CAMNT_0049049401 /DNA_START=1651 /DNA_END=2169 /DNA_ORIENTATION=-
MKFLVLFLGLCLAKKSVFPDTKAPLKPRYVSGELYCNACQGIVQEALKRLRHRNSEADVIESLEDICNQWNFVVYDYPPPEMHKGCSALMGDYSEKLETALMKRFELDLDVEYYFCHEVTRACVDVFWETIPGESMIPLEEDFEEPQKKTQQKEDEFQKTNESRQKDPKEDL